jgi:hypothetical protein
MNSPREHQSNFTFDGASSVYSIPKPLNSKSKTKRSLTAKLKARKSFSSDAISEYESKKCSGCEIVSKQEPSSKLSKQMDKVASLF